MALVTLRKVATPIAGGQYAIRWWQYDTDARTEVQDGSTSATADDFELAVDALVPGASFCLGTTRREVRYAGEGRIYTQDVPGSPACAFGPASIVASGSGLSALTADDGTVTVGWSMAGAPYTVTCALLEPGLDNRPDGRAQTFSQEYTTNAPVAQFNGFVAPTAGVSRGEAGIVAGRYHVRVTSQLTTQTVEAQVVVTPILPASVVIPGPNNGAGRTRVLLWVEFPDNLGALSRQVFSDGPLSVHLGTNTYNASQSVTQPELRIKLTQVLVSIDPTYTVLSLTVNSVDDAHSLVSAALWKDGNVTTCSVALERPSYWVPQPSFSQLLPYTRYCLPAGELLFESPIAFFGDQLSDGQGGIYYRRQSEPRPIEAANLIYFHPPRPGEPGGGIIVEVPEQAQPDGPALLFELLAAEADTVLASNADGRFGGLLAGSYRLRCSAPGSDVLLPLVFDFALQVQYGLRYYLDFDDSTNRQACRLELWTRAYDGLPQLIKGQAEVVEDEQQGVEAGALQGDLGSSVGRGLQLRLLTQPGELEGLMFDDRACRVDFYYLGSLQFSGYVEAGIFNEPLLSGLVPLNLLATDGLAELRNTDFAGDHGQELRGRYPAINTLLHCLSRTGLALPALNATNRRALEMTTAEVMETAAFLERRAYLEESGQPLDCRTVVDAICQAWGGTLFQREGCWQVRSLLEAAAPAAARLYGPSGTPDAVTPTLTVPAPTTVIRPPQVAVSGEWLWVEANQNKQVRPGWKSHTAAGNLGYTTNLFRAGDCFSLPLCWDETGTQLLPTTGWRAGSASAGTNRFGLKLVEIAGATTTAYTQWALPTGGSNYLESEVLPLAAGREGLPMVLSVAAKFQARLLNIPAGTALFTELFVELVADDADGKLHSFGHTLRFELQTDAGGAVATVSRRLPLGLPARLRRPRVRLHAVKGTRPTLLGLGAVEFGYLLVQAVQLQPLPGNAAWQSETSFTAVGPGGTTRPTEPLAVFHCDPPPAAGIFAGNAGAFLRTVSRGVNGPTTQWQRPGDVRAAPLLAAAALDVLALRAAPSRALTGVLRHRGGLPPQLLDSVDAPHDLTGRRWAVVGRRWNVKAGETEVTLVEIGEGEYLTPPVYGVPTGALLRESGVQQLQNYIFPFLLLNEDGVPVIEE